MEEEKKEEAVTEEVNAKEPEVQEDKTEETPVKEKRFSLAFLKKMSLPEKWTKKKVIEGVLAIIILVLVIDAGYVIAKKSGIRMNVFVSKADYKTYSHVAPDFSFTYPGHFVIDNDDQKKYGDSYISGFRLVSDSRTGCDVRSNSFGINFQKSDKEIAAALTKDVSVSAKDFKLVEAKKISIGGEKAFQLVFSFTDPLGSVTRLSQVIVSHNGGNYLLLCGTGDYQYKYFQSDFDNFYDSFKWSSKM